MLVLVQAEAAIAKIIHNNVLILILSANLFQAVPRRFLLGVQIHCKIKNIFFVPSRRFYKIEEYLSLLSK